MNGKGEGEKDFIERWTGNGYLRQCISSFEDDILL